MASNDRKINPSIRDYIYTRDNFTCRYCGVVGKPMNQAGSNDRVLTIDHLIPQKYTGWWTPKRWNLATCCMDCNGKKGGRLLGCALFGCDKVSLFHLVAYPFEQPTVPLKATIGEFVRMYK